MTSYRTVAMAFAVAVLMSLTCYAADVAAPAPVIDSIEPAYVPMPGGATVIIRGSGFDATPGTAVTVTFDGVPAASVKVLSSNEVHAVTPELSERGPKMVLVVNPDKRSAGYTAFRYGEPPRGVWQTFVARLEPLWNFVQADSSGIIYLLLFISLVAVAWTLHCLLVIRTSQVLPRKLHERLMQMVADNDLLGAGEVCRKNSCVLGRVIEAGLRKADRSAGMIREAVQAAGAREAARLQQKISYLSNIGVIAPMLGLLGTVWGMILAFQAHSGTLEGFPQTPLLMAAVSTAMNTTAAGLVVGIPAMSFFFFLRGRCVKLVTELEVVAEELVHELERRGAGR